MKKVQLIALFAVLAFVAGVNRSSAQSVKGKNFVNAGIGIGSFGFSGTGGLPVTVSFEHGFTDKISGGGFFGIIKRKFLEDYTYSYVVAGARASYHFNEELNVKNPKLDLYGGASLYYRGYKLKAGDGELDTYFKASGGNVGIGIHAAARYLFTEKVGGYAELGYGVSPLQLGVTLIF